MLVADEVQLQPCRDPRNPASRQAQAVSGEDKSIIPREMQWPERKRDKACFMCPAPGNAGSTPACFSEEEREPPSRKWKTGVSLGRQEPPGEGTASFPHGRLYLHPIYTTLAPEEQEVGGRNRLVARPEEHRLQRGTTEVIRNDHRREGISLTGMQPRGAEKRDKKKKSGKMAQ